MMMIIMIIITHVLNTCRWSNMVGLHDMVDIEDDDDDVDDDD